jgi:spermidine synthase
MARLYILFFCSGAAGLIYQIVWVREFGNAFGNTVHSTSLVLAVFMCGLGAGSYVAGRWADRHYLDEPGVLLRAYGYIEAAIAVLGLGISALLPRLDELSATISAYAPGPGGWYAPTPMSLLARYTIAVALLAPITGLMGGTLTLLIRHLVRRDFQAAGWRIGIIYGVNTAGAAAGCFLTDWAFIPSAGLWVTQLIAVALNLVAAIGALRLAATTSTESGSAAAHVPAVITAADTMDVGAVKVPFSVTAVALLLSGFAAMGMEIVWFRHLGSLLGSLRSVLSLILTAILIGIWLGSLAGGYLHRRVGHPVVLYVVAQAVFIIATLGALMAAETRGLLAGHPRLSFLPILRELGVPALMMGFAYPLANAIAQDAEHLVGRRAGLLYVTNTVGAVGGSLAVGFWLLPALGIQRSVTVLALAVLLGLVPLCLAARPTRAQRTRVTVAVPVASVVALGVAVIVWARLPADFLVNRTLWPLRPNEQRLAVSEGITDVVTVTEMPGEGRVLFTNGHSMSGTSVPAQRYMRAFVHIPLLSMDAPESVAVICFGVGNTAHAASLHPSVRRLEVVDTSRTVLAHADYFAATNGQVLRNAMVRVFVNDGRQHLRMRPPATFDLITLEPPPIAFAGVGSLYSREFYELARSRLRAGGYLTQWLPVSQVPPATALSMVRAFIDVFPQAVLLSGWMDELILMGRNGGPPAIDPARVEARLTAAPRLREDLARIQLGTLTELVGTFVAAADTLAAATEPYPPATDDYPIQEYTGTAQPLDHVLLTRLFDPSRAPSWCPACLVDGRPRPGLEGLPRHLALLASVYRDPAFVHYAAPPSQAARAFRVALDPAVARAAVAESVYLQRVFTGSAGPR